MVDIPENRQLETAVDNCSDLLIAPMDTAIVADNRIVVVVDNAKIEETSCQKLYSPSHTNIIFRFNKIMQRTMRTSGKSG